MKKLIFVIFLTFMIGLSACQAMPIVTMNPTPTQPELTQTNPAAVIETKPVSTPVAPPNATATPMQTISPTYTATQAPVVQLDLSRYDFDVQPPIDVLHNPPVIVLANEIVNIGFSVSAHYWQQSPQITGRLYITLYVANGEGADFTPLPLELTDQEGMDPYTAELPAVDESGRPLRRYYLKVTHPQVGLEVRYPTAGAVDIFVASELIPVDLPVEKPVEAGELALELPWGDGAEAVGLMQKREGYPWRVGPIAMDVAEDGRIALLDFVKERILIFDPTERSFKTILVTFKRPRYPDVQFDRNGQVAVFDPVGAPLDEQSTANIPLLYRFLSDGQIGAVAPVFVRWPSWLNKELQVFDTSEVRLVTPFDATGEVNAREIQREKTSPRLTMKYMLETVNDVRFADWEKGIAFAVHSDSRLGAICCFEKTPQGYLAVFESDWLRAIWFDEAGKVLKDVTLPREEYTEINPMGRTSVRSDGGLYYLRSTEKGIEVRYVPAP